MVPVLQGKRAVITGGGRGIGKAIAAALAAGGADLVLMGRSIDALAATADELKIQYPNNFNVLQVDLSKLDEISDCFARIETDFGPADILVNNAGIAPSAKLEKHSLEDWQAAFDVNVTAAFLACQAVTPGMRDRGFGRIINVASTAGLIGYPYVAGYVASKHALIGLTRALALELARDGNITVNAVCPGYTETDIAEQAIRNIMAGGKSEADARNILARKNPQGRLVQPEEVAAMVASLAAPDAAAVTGQAIAVAGGEVM